MPSEDANYKRKITAARRSQGICIQCGKVKVPEGRSRCAECLRKHQLAAKKIRDRYKENGLCYACGKQPPVAGTIHCENCLRKMRECQQAKRLLRKKQGLCIRCGKAAEGHKTLCRACSEKTRAEQQRSKVRKDGK